MLNDPVPDPLAAGWTQEGEESFQAQTNSLLISDNSDPGFCQFFNGDAAAFASDIVLSPSVLLSQGFTVESGGSTGVHVAIDDGKQEIRAVVFDQGGSGVKVALKTRAGFSNGFTFNSLQATFQLKRLADGTAVLSANGLAEERISVIDLPATLHPNQPRVEFGTSGTGNKSSSEWLTLGLAPVVPEQPLASFAVEKLQLRTKDQAGAEGDDRLRIAGNFATSGGSSVDPTTQSITLTLTRAGDAAPFWPPAGVMPIKAGFVRAGVNYTLKPDEKLRTGLESFEVIRGRTFHCADRKSTFPDQSYGSVVVELRIGDQVAKKTVTLSETASGSGAWKVG